MTVKILEPLTCPSESTPTRVAVTAFLDHGRRWDCRDFRRELGLALTPQSREAYTCLARLTDLLEGFSLSQLEALFLPTAE